MKRHAARICILALLITSSACSEKKDETATINVDSARQQATPNTASPETLKVRPEDLGKLADLIVAEAAELPRVEFDPAALAAKLGHDPQAHFNWVRDNTWWAPYRGLLRGSQGVLVDRVGSNLDRAVLLGDLLRRSGHEVRLAHAQLPEDLARELLAKMPPIPARRGNAGAAHETSVSRQREIEAIIPGVAKAVQQQSAETKRRIDKGAALVRQQTGQLYATVGDAATLDSNAADREAIVALRDHWWVELNDNGKWVAMDILKRDAKPGDAASQSTQTFAWSAANGAPSIPEDEWHTVQIRVVIERYLAGDTSESTLLETALRPAEVFGRPIALLHHPKPWPDISERPAGNPDALRDAALNVRVWTPALRVGDRIIAQSGFTESGDIKANPFDPIADVGGGGLFGGLDSALGGGEEYEPYASAEWIDYEIRVPGEPSQHLRRQVFDLLGPSRRRAKDTDFNGNADERRLERSEALLSRTDILLQPCEFTVDFIAYLAMSGIVAQQDSIRAFARERDVEKRKDIASGILERLDIWGPVLDFASWRSALGDHRGDWLISRPNLTSLAIGQRLTNMDQPLTWQRIDIAANAIDIRRGATRNPFEVRLERGVADTVAEMLTLNGDLSKAENTAAIFDMAGGGQSSGTLIAPRDMTAVTELGWPGDEAARVAEDINAGFIVVALRQPVELRGIQRVGWWRVDPASGETIGVMDSGFHGGQLEYDETLPEFHIHNVIVRVQAHNRARETWAIRGVVGMTVGSLAACLYCWITDCQPVRR